MHNPPSITEFIYSTFIDEGYKTVQELYQAGLGPVIDDQAVIDEIWAKKLSQALYGSSTMWLNMQKRHDEYIDRIAKENPDLPVEFIRDLVRRDGVMPYTRKKR